jgi:hypothetical protein
LSHDISSDDAKELLENRVKFKLYAAQQHLNNLKILQQNNESIRSFQGRIPWEIEIECFLFHIMGVKDSLLIRLNEKLKLGINTNKVKLKLYKEVNKALKTIGKGILLQDLNNSSKAATSNTPAGWLWVLNDLRVQSTHRNLLNIRVDQGIKENINTGTSSASEPQVYFKSDPQKNLEIIPFLEASLQNMKKLVEDIENKEPVLK